ncbi:MAG: hypothetical protein KF773_26055 [Deltaproteobacteria bacterium]|nr:hypothetical protein [Deltaproteobacteria bacterium]MCW5802587.1 hypothetical protein [Deltaproteobacteria bacterium]
MAGALFDPVLSWWQLLLIALGLVLVGEVGHLLGRRHPSEHLDEKKSHAGISVGALLGLLGLMLAFSFGIVESRFHERKKLVLEEANAIGTAYLRADMIPPPHRERTRDLLKLYVDVRLLWTDSDDLERAIERSSALQNALWSEATAASVANPQSLPVSNFVVTLNPMFDLRESRITVALHQRLPPTILLMLYTTAVLSIGVFGYSTGLSRTRSLMPTAAVVLAITAVVALIVDLDNPGSRLFAISQSALRDVQESMRSAPRPAVVSPSG